MTSQLTFDPKLDIAIERFIDAPVRLVWEALTEAVGSGTRYVFTALHRDEADLEKNRMSGWLQGTEIAIDQLVAHVASMRQAAR